MSPHQSYTQTMSRQTRRASIGYTYSSKPVLSSHHESKKDHGAEVLMCSCNASLVEKELNCLRESTSSALQQAWDEVNSLKTSISQQEEHIDSIQSVLKKTEKEELDALARIAKLEKQIKKKERPQTRTSHSPPTLIGCRLITALSTPEHISSSSQPQHKGELVVSARAPVAHHRYGIDASATSNDLEAEIYNLQMKIRQRDASIESMESTMSENVKLIRGMQNQICEWMNRGETTVN